ncbi:MAG: hypothetical protein ABIP51_06850 [Bacteroidia bacterium]
MNKKESEQLDFVMLNTASQFALDKKLNLGDETQSFEAIINDAELNREYTLFLLRQIQGLIFEGGMAESLKDLHNS